MILVGKVLGRSYLGEGKTVRHYVPESANGRICQCGNPAAHKVEERRPYELGHPYTVYVCCKCFGNIMGWMAKAVCEEAKK